jgi:Protein of unknown function with HXXEE motif
VGFWPGDCPCKIALKNCTLNNVNVLSKKTDKATSWTSLAWLFPVTYLLHIAEEYFADFPSHMLLTQGIFLSHQLFLFLQTAGLILMVLGILISHRLHFPNQMFVILAALIIGNSFVHMARSITFGGYEPGMLTSLLLWLPLGIATLLSLRRKMTRWRFVFNVATGIAISAAVEIISRARI